MRTHHSSYLQKHHANRRPPFPSGIRIIVTHDAYADKSVSLVQRVNPLN